MRMTDCLRNSILVNLEAGKTGKQHEDTHRFDEQGCRCQGRCGQQRLDVRIPVVAKAGPKGGEHQHDHQGIGLEDPAVENCEGGEEMNRQRPEPLVQAESDIAGDEQQDPACRQPERHRIESGNPKMLSSHDWIGQGGQRGHDLRFEQFLPILADLRDFSA